MIDFYEGNIHDIDHFMKVWALAKTIGEEEGLDDQTQEILEYAAVIHVLPVRYAGKNMETQMESIRKKKVDHWLKHFLRICR